MYVGKDGAASLQDPIKTAIVNAARELFNRFGYKKTTLEDIAASMRKGKSSLYYYFRNKEEIFQSVLETEESILFDKLREVVDTPMPAQEKFMTYVKTRMTTILGLPNYMKTLQDEMYGGYDFIQTLKFKNDENETALMIKIMEEGVRTDTFGMHSVEMCSRGIVMALHGLESTFVKLSQDGSNIDVQVENIVNILFYGIVKR